MLAPFTFDDLVDFENTLCLRAAAFSKKSRPPSFQANSGISGLKLIVAAAPWSNDTSSNYRVVPSRMVNPPEHSSKENHTQSVEIH